MVSVHFWAKSYLRNHRPVPFEELRAQLEIWPRSQTISSGCKHKWDRTQAFIQLGLGPLFCAALTNTLRCPHLRHPWNTCIFSFWLKNLCQGAASVVFRHYRKNRNHSLPNGWAPLLRDCNKSRISENLVPQIMPIPPLMTKCQAHVLWHQVTYSTVKSQPVQRWCRLYMKMNLKQR